MTPLLTSSFLNNNKLTLFEFKSSPYREMAEESKGRNELWLERFSKGRLKEMNDLKEKVKKRRGQLPSQRVPHHMRRRAVSHNPNRLPRRLRDKHTKERIAGGGGGIDGSKPKRPHRRFRRRPTQLLSEYNRRQSNSGIWLETHIWHAKRFSMTAKKWGMRLPDTPNDKGYRLAYRATQNKAIMFDISYYKLFELTSNSEEPLIKGLNHLLPPYQVIKDSSLSYAYTHLHLYEPDSYPYGYVGPVSVHAVQSLKTTKLYWIWVHPSYSDKVLDLLQSEFCLSQRMSDSTQRNETTEIETNESISNVNEVMDKEISSKSDLVLKTEHTGDKTPESSPVRKKVKLDVNEMKLAPRNIPFERTPKYIGPTVCLNDLSYTINRYRIIGPHGDRIFKATLLPSSVETQENGWWSNFFDCEKSLSIFKSQKGFWENELGKTIPDNVDVISLTTRDPRVLLPPKRSVIHDEKEESANTMICPEDVLNDLICSPLCNSDVRDKVSFSKCPDHIINEKRSKLIIPGSKIPLTDTESRVPILLMRRKYNTEGYGQGWDFISPGGWGMPFWMCFVMNGARTGGQTEIRNADFEKGHLSVLGSSPDSQAGRKEAEETAELDKELYFRYPPDKRCNFRKTGFDSPYLPKWKFLINDWIKDENPLIRESKNKLKQNDTMISKFYVLRDSDLLSKLSENPNVTIPDPNCLIPVHFKIIGKGTISKNAGVFVPSVKDLELFHGDQDNWHLLTEPVQDDRAEMCIRNSLKTEHTAKKINLRRKWKKVKDKLLYLRQKNLTEKTHDKEIQIYQTSLEELKTLRNKEILEYEIKMRTLWIDDTESTKFKDSSTRSVCGYVIISNFSLRKGNSIGLGYVVYPSLKYLNKDRILLIRDNNSFQYRFVKMSIILNNDSV
ncbi:ribonucleases P/MRP protein subunit POP1 isoform X2 [Lepeophtheirus salmonis]|uniref:ribonucleases P/MRP protein subunit POP1 isoform X2 n=1 Tax=Lepeophtheirus salmonis TaxID=72036 RepID=UPI001AE41773|nr:ribonucleases P/MRP protein subunit POP1-like isoform X2 [Lepeophtheirus salmonis]